jgi:hypothetical protein
VSSGGLGRKRRWPEVGFPRRPRRRRGGARRRGTSRRGGRPSSGLIATAGGGEAIGVVGLDGKGAEVGVRRRQELTEEEGNDGDQAPAKDWRRGGVVELRCGAVKLPRWSSGTMGGSVWELRGDQGFAGEEEGAAVVFRGSGQLESKRESGMEREGASDALEPEKRGREGVHGRLLRQRGGGRQSRGVAWHARERAREEELGRWPTSK